MQCERTFDVDRQHSPSALHLRWLLSTRYSYRHPFFLSYLQHHSPAGCTVQDLATGPDGTNEETNSSVGREEKILSVDNKNPSSNLPAHLFDVPQGERTPSPSHHHRPEAERVVHSGSKRRRPKHSEDDHAENPSKARKVGLPDSEQQGSESESGYRLPA